MKFIIATLVYLPLFIFAKQPNIILVFADDISAREIPIYGSEVWSDDHGKNTSDQKFRAKTPVLNKIAEEGCWIKTTWAATVCSPSRAMMMTGRYAHIHKWWLNGDLGKKTLPNGKTQVWPLYESSPKTIGHIAQEAGYGTYWAGKTQMKGSDVLQFGFEEGLLTPGEQQAEANPYTDFKISTKKVDGKKILVNEDTKEQLEVKSYAQSGWYWQPHVRLMNHPEASKPLEWWPNTPDAQEQYGLNTYAPDVELDFIFDYMDRKVKDKKPFFIYHTTHLGHDGFNFFNPDEKTKWPGTPKINWDGKKYTRTEPNITGDKGVYDTHHSITEHGIHRHIEYLDYQIWQYINKMEELGIADNTILIFCADNGTSGYGKSSPAVQKGTHVPLIIYAPGLKMTKKGEQDILVNISDVLPTLVEMTGTKLPDNYEINGKSLVPFLFTDKENHREWIYSYHGGKQLIRSKKLLKDGKDIWYDVQDTPKDLISFKRIYNWEKVKDKSLVEERDKLLAILPQYDKHAEAHDAPEGSEK